MIPYIYTSILGIAFLISLLSFRNNYAWHLKFFSILLGLTFVVETTALIMAEHKINNHWLYNLFMPLEFICYGVYYKQVITKKWVQKMIWAFIIIYPVLGVLSTLIIFKFHTWNSYEAIAGAFFTIVLSIVFYYEFYGSNEIVSMKTNVEFWIATGMTIFYSCQLPFLGTLNYLYSLSHHLTFTLFFIIQSLNILMYSIFAYAYLCRIIIKR